MYRDLKQSIIKMNVLINKSIFIRSTFFKWPRPSWSW